MRRREFIVLVGGALVAPSLAPGAAAQPYPTRPVTLVIPFPPGGGNDALGRMVADKMSKSIGQQIVVDNRGGAGGTIATRAVARASPDGHSTLLRLSRAGCSCQFGRASAPMIPQRVHTMRGPNDGTGTHRTTAPR
jgi:tripartite-type tricarboxylate transporter receptor subunit TctC